MCPRTIAIGDIHGCSAALAGLLRLIKPAPEDTIITLGDYVDVGMDSQGVLNELIGLRQRCNLVALLGNHEEMMLDARDDRVNLEFWLACGGVATLDSYAFGVRIEQIPGKHFQFLEKCLPFYETETHFFVHACYDPRLPLKVQDSQTRLWLDLHDEIPGPHLNGKIAVVGHTPQASDQILDLPHLKCIDTACGYDGLLTALDVSTGQIWQVDESGRTH